MKVAFLQHGLGYGGATKSLIVMQKALKKDIECHTILSRKKKINIDIKKQFIHSKYFVAFDIPSVYSYSESTIGARDFKKNKDHFPDKLIKYINDNDIDIIHINSSVFSNILKSIKEKTTCKIVVHLREMIPSDFRNEVGKYIIDNIKRYADLIIAISDNESHNFVSSSKLRIIPNPHDFSDTEKYLIRNSNQLNTVIIGMCSNFSPIKGHLDFLEMANLINKSIVNSDLKIEFRIIGYPKKSFFSFMNIFKKLFSFGYKANFDSKLKYFKINNLKITPFTFEIYKELSEFDIYVRPDKSANPWGRDIIEAMALKKCVIATGTSEYFVKDNETGYLVPPNSPILLSERVNELIYDVKKRNSMANLGYERIIQMCNLDLYRKKILDYYSYLIFKN